MLWHDLVNLLWRTPAEWLLFFGGIFLLIEGVARIVKFRMRRMRRRHRREKAEIKAGYHRRRQELDERRVWLAAHKQGQAGYAAAIQQAIEDNPELVARLPVVANRIKTAACAVDLIAAKRMFEDVQASLKRQLGTNEGPHDPALDALELEGLYPFLVEAFGDLVD